MASKWINTKLFENYVAAKENEATEKTSSFRRSEHVWASPQMGTTDKAKVYEGRFLPDQNGKFTQKYMYHMWKSGEKWVFYLCPKTHGMDKFCPICSIVSSLYTGTADDKALAFRMKRKDRHVGNFYIISDPRDKEIDDEAKKSSGKVKLYEFPSKLESKLKNEIVDKKEGLGYAIFDPGSEGHNIIIKIKATKTDAKGNSYPDYSDSIFSRKPSPVADSDNEIKQIMSSTYSIDSYIGSMEMSKENTVTMLKNEMLFDMIESEWARHNKTTNTETKREEDDDVKDFDEGDTKQAPTKSTSTGKTKAKAEPVKEDDLTEEDLLRELNSMT